MHQSSHRADGGGGGGGGDRFGGGGGGGGGGAGRGGSNRVECECECEEAGGDGESGSISGSGSGGESSGRGGEAIAADVMVAAIVGESTDPGTRVASSSSRAVGARSRVDASDTLKANASAATAPSSSTTRTHRTVPTPFRQKLGRDGFGKPSSVGPEVSGTGRLVHVPPAASTLQNASTSSTSSTCVRVLRKPLRLRLLGSLKGRAIPQRVPLPRPGPVGNTKTSFACCVAAMMVLVIDEKLGCQLAEAQLETTRRAWYDENPNVGSIRSIWKPHAPGR